MEPDTLDNVANWVKEWAPIWGVPEKDLAERAGLALAQHRAMSDLCGTNPKTMTWHWEDYFQDYIANAPGSQADSVVIDFDPLKMAAETEAQAVLQRKASQMVHDQIRKQLGMGAVQWTH